MIIAELFAAMEGAGLHWRKLCADASEIVLFGSRAVNCGAPESDWDLLVVGETTQRRRLTNNLDIVPCRKVEERWLGTDLATHVATYGRWLHGRPNWLHQVRYDEAAARKEALVAAGIRNLSVYWQRIAVERRFQHVRTLRLDVQRALRLKRGEAVPPTRILVDEWDAINEREPVRALLQSMNAPSPLLAELERT